MIYPISWLSGALYRRALKPILFRMSPDKVHEGMIRLGAGVQKIPPLRGLMRGCWSYQNEPMLRQDLLGLTFKNPLGMSAGLDKNFEIAGVASAIGFGQIEGGSITFKKCRGNDRPWFYRLPKTKSIVVHVGLANQGAPKILKRLAGYNTRRLRGLNLNASVAYTNEKKTKTEREAVADYVGSLELIKEFNARKSSESPTKINLVTLNVSCPNTYGGEPFTTPARLEKLLRAVDAVGLDVPLFVKMPSDKTPAEFDKLLDVILRHNVRGVTISNLFKDRARADLADDLPIHVPGNLSGRPTFETSNQLIAQTYRKCGDKLIISGVGGVFSPADAYAKIRAGASLVEMVTGLLFEGPQVVGQINRGLVKLLRRDGFSHVSDAVGIDAKNK
jgi:dihydroorotate dehydrogenase (fumarate)